MDVLSGIALAAPAGLNAYIPLLAVALAERFGWLTLRAPFDLLGEWWMIALIAVLLVVEIVADKIPAVDHVNDAIQTIVRPAAGGLLAASASGAGTVSTVALVVIGVLLAGSVHTAKAAARPVINATTGGAGAPVASTVEDVSAVILTVLAILVPLLTLTLVVVLIVWGLSALRRRRSA
jgi:uncharacterized membrane protein